MDASQGVLGHDPVLILAEDQTDSRVVSFVPILVVHHVAVKIDLAGVFRFEEPDFQVDDNKRSEPEMIKQQIDVKILPGDSNEGNRDALKILKIYPINR